MRTVSIGFYKDNGDFAIVATLNNNEGRMSDQEFEASVEQVSSIFAKHLGMWHTFVLQRQDAPDYITIEESTSA